MLRANSACGSPRIHNALRQRGIRCGEKRVARLMREHGIRARRPRHRRSTTDSTHTLPVAENVLDRQFEVRVPNARWAADITYLWTCQGWLYLAVVMDLFSRRIVGWSMQQTLARSLVIAALQMALQARRPQPGLLHHSDRGSQYASVDYQQMLEQAGCMCSMSRRVTAGTTRRWRVFSRRSRWNWSVDGGMRRSSRPARRSSSSSKSGTTVSVCIRRWD